METSSPGIAFRYLRETVIFREFNGFYFVTEMAETKVKESTKEDNEEDDDEHQVDLGNSSFTHSFNNHSFIIH